MVSGIHGGFIACSAVQHCTNTVGVFKVWKAWSKCRQLRVNTVQSRTIFCNLEWPYNTTHTEIQYIWMPHVPVSFRFLLTERYMWLQFPSSNLFMRPHSVCMHYKSGFNIPDTTAQLRPPSLQMKLVLVGSEFTEWSMSWFDLICAEE